MPRRAGADDSVARGGRTSARVPGDDARDAFHMLEHGVHAPEASSRQHGDLLPLGRRDARRGGERGDLRLSGADQSEDGAMTKSNGFTHTGALATWRGVLHVTAAVVLTLRTGDPSWSRPPCHRSAPGRTSMSSSA